VAEYLQIRRLTLGDYALSLVRLGASLELPEFDLPPECRSTGAGSVCRAPAQEGWDAGRGSAARDVALTDRGDERRGGNR
jgi:hypothetical protein